MKNQIENSRFRQPSRGLCLWCGCTEFKPRIGAENVCPDCVRGRDWLLMSMRHSDHLAKYVASRETKMKEERNALQVQPKNGHSTADPRIDRLEKRSERLENMMEQLMELVTKPKVSTP